MSALFALLLSAPLLYLPGWLLAQAMLHDGESTDLLERIFERTLLGALLNGWLALTLAELAIFSIWLQLALLGVVCASAYWRIRRQAHAAHPPTRPGWDTYALTIILAIFACSIAARPFEVVLGVRDAGVYANTGFAIARTGALIQHDSIVAAIAADQQSDDAALREAAAQAETNFLSVQPRQRTIATRLRQAGFFINAGDLPAGRVVPQGLHLFPAWIALLASLAGLHGGLAATGLLGLLGIWSVAMLGRRLGGPWVGVAAALLLASNGVQIWFARYSTAEAIAQFLTFSSLYCFAVMQHAERRTQNPEPRTQNSEPQNPEPRTQNRTLQRHSVKPQDSAARNWAAGEQEPETKPLLSRATFVALLAGLAFGQVALARIDFFLVVAPAALYLGYTWLTHRWRAPQNWFGLGLLAMLVHAGIHIALFARAYFFDTLFARLQDYALTALIALPFLTPPLRDLYLLRPCSPIAIQPCPPIKGMPPTTFTGWNYGRIFTELAIVGLAILAIWAIRRWGQPVLAWFERQIQRRARLLLRISAFAIGLLAAYAYLVRPQILTRETLAALPGCISPAQLRTPTGACLRLQGYIGAPVAAPAYSDPAMAWLDGLPQRVRGKQAPSPAECAAFRNSFLPASADGRTSVELRSDGLTSEPQIGAQNWAKLQACDRTVLRDLFANSQANLVRIGWYLSPLGIALAALGLALWWRNMRAESWLFLAVALIATFFFVRLTYGASDQRYIYILRRYVPQVYPAFCLGMAYALTQLAQFDARQLLNRLQPASNPRPPARLLSILAACGLGAFLLLFNLATNLKIITHTEYAGALDQIGTIAAQFRPNDVLLLRGGAPSYTAARDIPDNLATPLTYGFGLHAFTIKSAEPGNYATQLARYVAQWRSEGREVYLLAGASGAVGLPGFQLEAIGPARLDLNEFEQPTEQKPTNIQAYTLDMQIYRIVPNAGVAVLKAIPANDYAAEVAGLYRSEQLAGEQLAWSDGEALLRIPWPSQPTRLIVRLAAGATRPARLGAPKACIAYRPELQLWPEDPQAPAFEAPTCFTLTPEPRDYTIMIDPRSVPAPAGGSLLLRIQSDTWIPARDDPSQHDRRQLGVLFGGITIAP